MVPLYITKPEKSIKISVPACYSISTMRGVSGEMVVPARHFCWQGDGRDTGTGSPVPAPWDISLLLSVRSFGSAQFDGGLSGSNADI
jgi:hypothetical protein